MIMSPITFHHDVHQVKTFPHIINILQAIKSFSIRPGKQHVTFCFPFMMDILRRHFRSDVTNGGELVGSLGASAEPNLLTPALFFDYSLEVIEGYQSFITLAPAVEQQ